LIRNICLAFGPLIGRVFYTLLLTVLQPERFDKASQAAAYLGEIHVESQSDPQVSSLPRLSKAGEVVILDQLFMAAMADVS